MRDKQEARKILNIYRLFQRDGTLYLNDETDTLDTLFEAVIHAVTDCGTLKAKLPYTEFVLPSRKVIEGDSGWVGHFDEKDNRRFFLSDIYDYLYLMYGRH